MWEVRRIGSGWIWGELTTEKEEMREGDLSAFLFVKKNQYLNLKEWLCVIINLLKSASS